MTVKLIAENTLESGHFLSATEQEGERWGQPDPTSANAGGFRLVTKGVPTNFSYSGTATSNGAAGGTTVIDSALMCYGDDFFTGATVTMTSGTCTGESKTVTDFAQATGVLTTGAFSAQIDVGDTFTLTLAYSNRDFRVELIASGDAKTSTFKWSYDGSITYFGRDSPNQATWLDDRKVADSDVTAYKPALIDVGSGTVLAIFKDSATDIVCYVTTNNGITWAKRSTIVAWPGSPQKGAIRLSSGRILAVAGTTLYYSDDDGFTWTSMATSFYANDFAELSNGSIIKVYSITGLTVESAVSSDGGQTWSTAVTVANDAGNQNEPAVCIADNGDIVCVYASDEDAGGNFEIKAKISQNNGATWGTVKAVINFTNDRTSPSIVKDINGDLYVTGEDGAFDIVLSRSTDHGATWSTGSILMIANAANPYKAPVIRLIDGHQIWCLFVDETADDIRMVRRGIWETYSANACTVAPYAEAQRLICGAELVWHGGAGIAGDDWTFAAEYDYAMSNVIEDSPSKPWRSEQDNIECNIVLKIGDLENHYVDGVGFFGCNVRTLSFQMNNSDSWGSPSVNETISFDLTTGGALDAAADENFIKDSSLLANYNDHELKGYYVRFTSGNMNGYTFIILDNVGDYIALGGNFDFWEFLVGNTAQNDTFTIFQNHVSKTFTGGQYKYVRLSISAQRTCPSETYYQIGSMIAGRAVTLTDAMDSDYGKTHVYDVELLRTPFGGLISIQGADRKRTFELTWSYSNAGRKELLALLDYIQGKNIVLIPDSSVLTDVYLIKRTSEVKQKHYKGDYFTMSAEFEEVL
jgi:hypothetical protein